MPPPEPDNEEKPSRPELTLWARAIRERWGYSDAAVAHIKKRLALVFDDEDLVDEDERPITKPGLDGQPLPPDRWELLATRDRLFSRRRARDRLFTSALRVLAMLERNDLARAEFDHRRQLAEGTGKADLSKAVAEAEAAAAAYRAAERPEETTP